MFKVQSKPCSTCIYRKDCGLDIKELEAQVADPYGGFKSHRICHQSHDVCCRGFWNRHKNEFPLGQIAQRLNAVEYVQIDIHAHRRERSNKRMKIELKKISYNKRLSQETNAFAADVFVDGKKAGMARNDGHGGDTMVHLHLMKPEEAQKVFDYCESLPDHVYPASHGSPELKVKMDLEQMVDNLLEAYLDEKYGEKAQKTKWCKKEVCFRLKGDQPNKYRFVKKDNGKYTQRQKDYLVKTYGDKIEEILNETLGEMPS